ncbi:hypothetical protein BDZ91DRAFT_512811 [Kalaharituber pfeilii]|nr:hypothetical protein BDZ91DRAFT_512811 [Kalaharituber pfeilii]
MVEPLRQREHYIMRQTRLPFPLPSLLSSLLRWPSSHFRLFDNNAFFYLVNRLLPYAFYLSFSFIFY